jgi:hypothetical protein
MGDILFKNYVLLSGVFRDKSTSCLHLFWCFLLSSLSASCHIAHFSEVCLQHWINPPKIPGIDGNDGPSDKIDVKAMVDVPGAQLG